MTRKKRGEREVDLDAYTAWLKTDEAAEAFREAEKAADEDAEVFYRTRDLVWEDWNTPIMPVHRR